jgi:hypothetical protein
MMARHKLILFEGDRIGNVSFFEAVAPYHEIKIYLLEVSEEEKARRHIARNDNQSEKFLKAKKTKLLDKPCEQTIIKRSIGICLRCLSRKIPRTAYSRSPL